MLMEPLNKIMNEGIMQHKPKHDNNEVRLAVLETSVSHIYQSLERIEKNLEKLFDSIDRRFDKIDERLKTMDVKFEALNTKMDVKFDTINNRMWTNFLWILGVVGFSPIVMKFCFKWLGV